MRPEFPLTFTSGNTASRFLVICPCCKNAFTPRTATQSVCGLQCFYEMKRGKLTGSEPVEADATITSFHGGEGQVNQESKHSSLQVAEDATTHNLKEWVMEAAGTGYLTEAQIGTVIHSLTRSTQATTPGDVGIAELMQLIELARTGGLDDSDYANRTTTSYHQAVGSTKQRERHCRKVGDNCLSGLRSGRDCVR